QRNEVTQLQSCAIRWQAEIAASSRSEHNVGVEERRCEGRADTVDGIALAKKVGICCKVGGGTDPPGVAYVYAPDRTAQRSATHLAGFQGVLQVDGYEAYKVLARRGAVQLAFCWSHVRRPFYELAQSGPAPIAAEALVRIAALYRIEAEIRGRSA